MFRFLLVWLLICSCLHAQETLFKKVFHTKSDTYVEAVALFTNPSPGGYLPVRVTLVNNQKIPHRVTLSFTSSASYNSDLSTNSQFAFAALPGEKAFVDILVPLKIQNGSRYNERVAVELEGSMGKDFGSLNIPFEVDQPAVLLSKSLHSINGSPLDAESTKRSSTGSYSSSVNREFAGYFSPKELPDDWRAFSGYDSVILTDEDWSEIPPGPRNAIISWVRLGGQLIVYSQTSPSAKMLGLPEDSSFGQILIRKISSDLRLDPKNTIDLVNAENPTKARALSATEDFSRKWPIQLDFGEKSFNYGFFIAILVIFGILVGPVNLFVFAKSGQRHRLFVTTPIISVATSLLLIALIIFQDGFGGSGTRLILMEVRADEGQNAAFVHQEQFSRTGIMTSPSFNVDTPALLAQVPLAESRWARLTRNNESGDSYNLQPSGQNLYASGGWFQSRSEQGQSITAVVPTRGRIEQGNLENELISTFDFTIDTLFYQDPSGNWFRAENIAKGKQISLNPIDPTMVIPELNKLEAKFTKRNRNFLNNVSDRPDSFIALTKSAPAVETNPGIDWKTQTIITGPIAR